MYRALYRKWRPQRFEDVVGQRAIVTALKNQITANRVGHAYLFTGVRGTGKTTCAKIFAKAVNCLHPVNGDPCGECEICKGIDNGSILDVVEMDAASNNGVDDIRDLRDETAYTPSACKYKVYIIDEVHMLSTAAFNALLKTLEEPPAHVIFILATTEIQKVPATILSRFRFCKAPVEIRENGLICRDTVKGEDGRFTQVEGSEIFYPHTGVIVSVSQGSESNLVKTTTGIETNQKGLLTVSEDGSTTREGVFAGGDAVMGARTVVEAVAVAKKVAESMDAYMKSLPAEEVADPYVNIPVFQTPTSDVLAKQEI